ncbi:AMP-binding protein [Streptomyces albipurpureus]|uniref:AMP-binding protein n=1 Tax=Streptomyces albipurpureus TaxID=2897419 RepID=UPI0031F2FE1E
MFTSGSTGRPNGAAVTQGNLAGLAADRWWSEEGADRVLLCSPHAFDAFNPEMWRKGRRRRGRGPDRDHDPSLGAAVPPGQERASSVTPPSSWIQPALSPPSFT